MTTTETLIEVTPAVYCSGKVRIPASKSHAQRALACALISNKKTVLHGVGTSNDEQVLVQLIRQSAAEVALNGNTISVGAGEKLRFNDPHIRFGESGLAARMCTPILANCPQKLTLSGNGSLNDRPMQLFGKVLPAWGVDYTDNNGKLPIQLQGPLLPTSVTIDGSLSSQFITGVLYGIAGSLKKGTTTITLENPVSIPYLDLSLAVLREFGADVERNNTEITISGPVNWKETTLSIEGDWSSASFLLVLAALSGEITITNLNPESLQADRRITEALTAFGANVSWNDQAITVRKDHFQSFEFDATHCPDLFPPLAALHGPARMSGLFPFSRLDELIVSAFIDAKCF